MNFSTVKDPSEIAVRGARVHFEHEDQMLKRIILLTDNGTTFVIRAEGAFAAQIKVLKLEAETASATPTEAPIE